MTNLSDLVGGAPIPVYIGSFKNKIINGNFDIWQRGTSFTSVATSAYTADRFQYKKSGTMVHNIIQDTDVPSGINANYSFKLDCTTADTVIAAGDYCFIRQRIEGFNFFSLVGKTATLSFYVKATKTGTYCISFVNSGGDRSYIVEYTINSANTWENKAITLAFDYLGGTWNYTNGIGIEIAWALAGGSTIQATPGTWQSGTYYTTSNQVNACDNVANNFWLSQVQLEIGSSATSFESRSIQQELVMCQRYYEKSYQYSDAPGTATNTSRLLARWPAADNDGRLFNEQFRVSKRTTPTMAWYSTNSGNSGYIYYAGGSIDVSVSSTGSESNERTGIPNLGISIPDQGSCSCHWAADAEL